MTDSATKTQLEKPESPEINFDGLTDDQCEVIGKLASVLRALHTSDARRELEDFWAAWSRMSPAIPRAAVEPLLERFIAIARNRETERASDR